MSHRTARRREVLVASGAALVGGVAGCVRHVPLDKGQPNDNGGSTIHVGPDGGITNAGTEDAPLGSIHRAVNLADQGDTVYVHSGEYTETVEVEVDGTPEKPITLTGPDDAVLKPPAGNDGPVLGIDASHVHLTGLTIDGLLDPDAPNDPASYHRDKLISINGDASGPDDYLEGLVVSPHALGGAGQALINSVQFRDSEVGGFRVIGPAGTKWIFGDDEGHNGEVVYLGTAPDNRKERGYDSYDRTRNVRVHHIDNSQGHLHSELVDCKAGVEDVTIEYCMDGGGAKSNDSYYTRSVSMDGTGCTVRWNVFADIHGDGVRIGPQNYLNDIDWVDSEPQSEYDRQLGTGHAIYGNVFAGCTHEAINFLRESQRPGRDTNPTAADQQVICGNLADGYSDVSGPRDCPDGVPATDGVGHMAGESPWDDTPPTKTAAFERYGQHLHLEVRVHREAVPAGTTFEVPVTVTNTGAATEEVVVGFRSGEHRLDEETVTVAPGDDNRVTLTENLPPIGEVAVTRNGQKIGSVYVREE